MADTQEAVVRIRLTASGNAVQQTQALLQEMRKVAKQQEDIGRTKLDARKIFTRADDSMQQVREQHRLKYEHAGLDREVMRQQSTMRRASLDSGQFVGELRKAAKSERQVAKVDRQEERAKAQVRREYVGTPDHIKELRERQKDARQAEKDALAERKAESVAKYGRFGSWLANAGQGPVAKAGMGIATGVAGSVAGLATKGFQNTVEWNRLTTQITLLSREIAGAFVPAIKMVTGVITKLRHVIERFGPLGQDMLAFGTTAVLASKSLSFFSHSLTGKGPGELLAKLFANREGQFTKGSVGQGGLIAAIVLALLYAVQSKSTKQAIAGEVGIGKETSNFLNKYVARGQATDLIERFHDLYDNKKKTKVTPAGTSFEEIGAGYDRLTKAAAEVEGQKAEPEKTVEQWLEDIYSLMKQVITGKDSPTFKEVGAGVLEESMKKTPGTMLSRIFK